MPRVADYKIINDDSFTLESDPNNPPKTITFNIASPHFEDRSILALKLNLVDADEFRFRVEVNGKQAFERAFSGDGIFTFHEVLSDNLLLPIANSIQFKYKNGTGSVKISDIVLWYQHAV